MQKNSFLHIDNISEENREQLLQIRRVLLNSLLQNSQKEEMKGMYIISLAVFTEFERLTSHITNSKLVKS